MAKSDDRTTPSECRWIGLVLRGASVAGLATVAVALFAGSSGASMKRQSTEAPRLVRSAYTRTIDAKTAMVTLNESVTASSGTGSPQQVNVTGQGAENLKGGDGSMSFTSASGSFEARFISPNIYLAFPASLSSQLPPGKKWVSINVNTVTETKLGQSLSQLSSSSQQSTQLLSYLQAVSASGITMVGQATIKGVPTTEYKATVDLSKAAALKGLQPAEVQELEGQLHTTSLPIEVWLDGQGRVRQVSTQLQTATTGSTGTSTAAAPTAVTATVDYYDFGTPVTVQAPPASQVYDITSQAVAGSSSTTTSGREQSP